MNGPEKQGFFERLLDYILQIDWIQVYIVLVLLIVISYLILEFTGQL